MQKLAHYLQVRTMRATAATLSETPRKRTASLWSTTPLHRPANHPSTQMAVTPSSPVFHVEEPVCSCGRRHSSPLRPTLSSLARESTGQQSQQQCSCVSCSRNGCTWCRAGGFRGGDVTELAPASHVSTAEEGVLNLKAKVLLLEHTVRELRAAIHERDRLVRCLRPRSSVSFFVS